MAIFVKKPMHFLSRNLEEYITDHSAAEPELLIELSRETHLKVLRPRMISGHYQGRILSLISKMVRPRNILEIGTYTGYSALCLAEGLTADGTLHTIDLNEELTEIQQRYFKKSVYDGRIRSYLGDALCVLPEMDVIFDLVFIDAEKTEYASYFEAVLKKTRSGSIILSDNVLWSGKVAEASDHKDAATEVLKAYNDKLSKDPRVETVLLPIRDGLALCRVR